MLVSRLWPRPSERVTDRALALVVAAIELSDMFVFGSGRHRGPLDVALLLTSALSLVAWRHRPFLILQVAGWSTIALAALHADHIGLGAIAATYAVACWATARSRRAAAPLILIAVWLVPLLTADASSIPTNAALFGAAWLLGSLARQLTREREEKAAMAVGAERARIARELHDVLAHSVSVMVIQAQGAQAVDGTPERVRRALSRIEATGAQSLGELRALLRGAPGDGAAPLEPLPGLARLPELLATVHDAGVDVSLERGDEATALPASVELSAYRIVQEALTNTLRHSASRRARITIGRVEGELLVEICDEGPRRVGATGGAGRGIAGMRERAAAVGGTLVAAPRARGFCVTARLPLAR